MKDYFDKWQEARGVLYLVQSKIEQGKFDDVEKIVSEYLKPEEVNDTMDSTIPEKNVLKWIVYNQCIFAKSEAMRALDKGYRSALLEYVGNYVGDFDELRQDLEEDFGKTLEDWLKELEA